MEKKRAPRNRTITVSENESILLKKKAVLSKWQKNISLTDRQ